ncbi:MAG: hypothetical protein PHE06_09665 [Lachnospiraceae bacterium]|nr:hypothetical protein [Lachnospiraceae bacterium]
MNNYLVGLEGMKVMLTDIERPMETFKKKFYTDSFRCVYEKNVPVMDAIENVYSTVIDKDTFLDNMAKALVDSAVSKSEECKKKSQKEALMMDMNMAMAIYVLPSLLEYKGTSSQPLVDRILVCWKEAFPKTNLQAADYEYIEKGFHKKFCYITTAVCETFHKPDDCYELTLLRDYRDHYLMSLPEGEAIIRQYYDVAPTIVKHINHRKDSAAIYESIWDTYLSPCIHMIEEGENNSCKELYIEMVQNLQEEYFYLQ